MLIFLKRIWPLALLVALVYTLDRPWGMLPAVGKLFSPFYGFFQHAEDLQQLRQGTLELAHLKGEVSISYDDNGVPHIFATNDHDLYLAQGYAVAKDRLWQMDFYSRAADGRLTEVVGNVALELDRYHRRLGMAYTAREIVEYLRETDSLSYAILEAYATGVNAYIASLDGREFPLEYKILGYQPERWSPYKSILMLMNMRHDLSVGTNDYRMSNVLAQIGIEATTDLFPDYPFLESPIIPTGTVWDFDPLAIPAVPDTVGALTGNVDMPAPVPAKGSNNWAISGTRSATGLPLLANDPHLTLSLPSIWYQMQLHAPGVNVYGVALPGMPTIIIGFNKDVAWGVTNVGSDVMDFYQIRFRNEQKQEYWHDETWKPVYRRVEVYRRKGESDFVDTVYVTHHGPIVYHEKSQGGDTDFPVGHAMRWVANESRSSDLLTFHYLNRARNYDDYRTALSYFAAPAQNFVFADNENDIAITSNGRFPLKWHGQGRFLMDGTLAANDWQGWIPNEHNPSVRNPERGFVSSANQFPVDSIYPYYLGWNFASPSRALRINERLEEMQSATVGDFVDLLHDNYNMDARLILADLLKELAADELIAVSPAFHELERWDLMNEGVSVAASIFERWIPRLSAGIWKDEFPEDLPVRYPTLYRTYQLLLDDPESDWFDDRSTPDIRESKGDIVRRTFLETIQSLEKKYGPLEASIGNAEWQWTNVKHTTINHLIPTFESFSRRGIMSGGGARIVNATTHSHGPSWRMIVQLDKDWPQAWGLFPGGQSGNPGSPYYDNMIDAWAIGSLDKLLFLRDAEQRDERLKSTFRMKPSTRN